MSFFKGKSHPVFQLPGPAANMGTRQEASEIKIGLVNTKPPIKLPAKSEKKIPGKKSILAPPPREPMGTLDTSTVQRPPCRCADLV